MKTILSIAGSDSFGGAGIQADIKTAEAHGVYSATVLTAVTAQNTLGVSKVVPMSTDFIKEQFLQVSQDLKVDAMKIGMLGTQESIECVKALVKDFACPIVLDPVAVSRAGAKLLDDSAIDALQSFFPLVTVITPNRYETELFFSIHNFSETTLRSIGSKEYLIAVKNIAFKSEQSIDVLVDNDRLTHFETPMAHRDNTHGTGCSFSTAIACNLALGKPIEESISEAKNYIKSAIENAPNFGKGNGPIRHGKGLK